MCAFVYLHIDTYVQRETRGMHTGRGCERNTSTYAPAVRLVDS